MMHHFSIYVRIQCWHNHPGCGRVRIDAHASTSSECHFACYFYFDLGMDHRCFLAFVATAVTLRTKESGNYYHLKCVIWEPHILAIKKQKHCLHALTSDNASREECYKFQLQLYSHRKLSKLLPTSLNAMQ